MPVLYATTTSPPGRAVMMMAHILGIDLDFRELNPVAREQDTPEFAKKNPMKTVPIYEEEDFCLADSHAIMLYLLEKYGKPEHTALYPKDLKKRAVVHQRLFHDCGVLFVTLRNIMGPTFMGRLTKLNKYMTWSIEKGYQTLEDYLTETKYLADDTLTVADVSAVPTISTLQGLYPIDMNKYPKTLQWLNDMAKKDFYIKCNAMGNEQLVSILTGFMKANEANRNSKL